MFGHSEGCLGGSAIMSVTATCEVHFTPTAEGTQKHGPARTGTDGHGREGTSRTKPRQTPA
eukprot:3332329-Prymnesium_polylepis.1